MFRELLDSSLVKELRPRIESDLNSNFGAFGNKEMDVHLPAQCSEKEANRLQQIFTGLGWGVDLDTSQTEQLGTRYLLRFSSAPTDFPELGSDEIGEAERIVADIEDYMAPYRWGEDEDFVDVEMKGAEGRLRLLELAHSRLEEDNYLVELRLPEEQTPIALRIYKPNGLF